MNVDFYLIDSDQSPLAWRYAAHLAGEIFEAGETLYVHTADATAAEQFDDLLWTFHDIGFVPHKRAEDQATSAPIVIGHGTPEKNYDHLLNLAPDVPDFFQQFPHTIEVFSKEANSRTAARARYRQYREAGCTLKNTEIAPNSWRNQAKA